MFTSKRDGSLMKKNSELCMQLSDARALVQLLCHPLVFLIMVARGHLKLQPVMSLHDNIQR